MITTFGYFMFYPDTAVISIPLRPQIILIMKIATTTKKTNDCTTVSPYFSVNLPILDVTHCRRHMFLDDELLGVWYRTSHDTRSEVMGIGNSVDNDGHKIWQHFPSEILVLQV